jgi:carbon-monoxide dehydrogenase medium subunit
MYETQYHRPKDVAEAAKIFAGAADARYLAGGQTLLPTMKQRLAAPSDVIDLRKLPELTGISVTGDAVTSGAATTHAEVNTSDAVRKAIPALAYLASLIGDPAVRHMGTIGGSLANNDPAADFPAAVMALNAMIKTDKRTIPAEDFFTGLFSTALEPGEVIVSVTFPIPAKAAYAKFDNPASRYAMAAVFVAKLKDGAVRGRPARRRPGRRALRDHPLWNAEALGRAARHGRSRPAARRDLAGRVADRRGSQHARQ